ncbi:gibberellin 3-beta-dioxygenase 1 [Beta vulgaris subsp. vulgaris]|uniref:gibberellin 3-beta-dioxygenase 1 n=1 Tax=Beta vulgaris subsp. vulgaris TaxID=3555 RepID=UPI0020368C31|nr:gibberellin 3-beta-dioxygenase 1 [Beta vulgaris subsp. vulgaris]
MPSLTDAYKNHPVEHNLIAPLDFSLIKDVPESHAWIQSNDLKENPNINKKELGLISVPIINLEDTNVLELIFNACETWGMFQVTNHGISKQLLEQVEFEAKKLFNLPFEEKMKTLRSPEAATGYGYPRITPFFSKLMWNEGFTIMGNSLIDHAKILWPNDFQGFCDVMEEYQTRMKDLSDKLMGLLLKSLNIPGPYMKEMDNDLCTALQLNSYPTCPNPTRTMGLAQHTDTFLFTILHQSANASGLQVFKDGPGWVSVDPHPGALVVNVGDLLHIISNARFPSAIHRAVVNNATQRLSFAYFYGPPLDFQVAPFLDYPGCEGPTFKSLKVKEYVGIKSKYLDMALSFVRKSC